MKFKIESVETKSYKIFWDDIHFNDSVEAFDESVTDDFDLVGLRVLGGRVDLQKETLGILKIFAETFFPCDNLEISRTIIWGSCLN